MALVPVIQNLMGRMYIYCHIGNIFATALMKDLGINMQYKERNPKSWFSIFFCNVFVGCSCHKMKHVGIMDNQFWHERVA